MKKHILSLIGIALSLSTVCAQEEESTSKRLPIEGQFILVQKVFKPVTITNSILEIDFTGKRTHSVGIGYSQDFTLSKNYKDKPYFQLHTAVYGTSATVKYDATLRADIHNLDQDATWSFQKQAFAVEGYVGISRNMHLNENMQLRFGFGFNLQDMFVNTNMLRVRTLITANGQTQQEQVVGAVDQFFGFQPASRPEQDVHFNPVYTVGLRKKLPYDRTLVIDLRFCGSSQPMRVPYELNFGSTGELHYHKGYAGLSIGLTLPYNNTVSL